MARFPFPVLSLSLTLLAAGPAAAVDWPQFRGAGRPASTLSSLYALSRQNPPA